MFRLPKLNIILYSDKMTVEDLVLQALLMKVVRLQIEFLGSLPVTGTDIR